MGKKPDKNKNLFEKLEEAKEAKEEAEELYIESLRIQREALLTLDEAENKMKIAQEKFCEVLIIFEKAIIQKAVQDNAEIINAAERE